MIARLFAEAATRLASIKSRAVAVTLRADDRASSGLTPPPTGRPAFPNLRAGRPGEITYIVSHAEWQRLDAMWPVKLLIA